MENHEIKKQIKKVKKLTSKDHTLAGGFNRTSLWFVEEFKPQPVKDDMVFSTCYLATVKYK